MLSYGEHPSRVPFMTQDPRGSLPAQGEDIIYDIKIVLLTAPLPRPPKFKP